MKKLNTQLLLTCALAGVAIMRAQEIRNETMPYEAFARAIGLIDPDDKWLGNAHNRQVSLVMYFIGAMNGKTGDKTVDTGRIVNASTGKPGARRYREPRLIIGTPDA